MKPLLAWVKGNLVTVICVLVILLTLPAGFVLSTMWRQSVIDERQSEASGALSRLDGVKTVRYSVPVPIENAEPLEDNAAPNPRRTDAFRSIAESLERDADRVVSAVRSMNQRDHEVLIAGLFPEPASELRGQQLALDFVKRLVGDDGRGGAYAELLASIEAGPGADNEAVRQQLQDAYDSEVESVEAQTGRTSLTQEERDELTQELIERRIAAYQRNARRVSMFATIDALLGEPVRAASSGSDRRRGPRGRGSGGGSPAGWASRPAPNPDQPPSVDESYAWQHDYWVVRDMLMAMDAANRDAEGQRTRVERSPVKRLVALRVGQLFSPQSLARAGRSGDAGPGGHDDFGGGGFDGGGGGGGAVGAPSDGVYPTDPAVSITGRAPTPNQLYDMRRVEIVAVVASSRIEEVIGAIEASNLISVLDLSIASIDPAEHLAQGYWYGEEHVVELTLQLETLWLRSWTVPSMPPAVRAVLGVPEEAPEMNDEEFGG